jgi:ketosteroid isomerase-like protein
MDKPLFQAWLDRYLEAWRSYDPAAIGDLFSENVEYRYHPWDDPVRGREAVVRDWVDNRDAEGSWRANYTAHSVEGDLAVATGTSDYLTDDRSAVDRTYHNVFLCRFDADGRCSSFTEYFMQEPKPSAS